MKPLFWSMRLGRHQVTPLSLGAAIGVALLMACAAAVARLAWLVVVSLRAL